MCSGLFAELIRAKPKCGSDLWRARSGPRKTRRGQTHGEERGGATEVEVQRLSRERTGRRALMTMSEARAGQGSSGIMIRVARV